jgi:hypothetical protein
VIVSSQISLGTTGAASDNLLRLYMCYQATSGGITHPHGSDWMTPIGSANSRADYALTDSFAGLPAGSYSVGMCGTWNEVGAPGETNPWNSTDWSYTTAQVISGASISTGSTTTKTDRSDN